jgi:hypothetical protein
MNLRIPLFAVLTSLLAVDEPVPRVSISKLKIIDAHCYGTTKCIAPTDTRASLLKIRMRWLLKMHI